MARKQKRQFNGVEFVQFGAVPLHGHEKTEAEQRHREGERLRLRPLPQGGLVAFIHPDDLTSNPA